MRIAIDAMGGDRAPEVPVTGALQALAAERIALRDEAETASVERLDQIIDRCEQIQIKAHAIRRSASELAASLNGFAAWQPSV